jgi:hypothetical protein
MAAILDSVSVDYLTNAWVDGPICLWLIGGDCRKVPFHDQRRLSFKMATMAPIKDLVSVDYLTDA